MTVEEQRTGAAGVVVTPAPTERLFANREYRGLALAQFTSECGDQMASIALSLLVYGRSHSPLLAAATYAVTYVPWVLGALVLSPLADRFARRETMMACDAARAVLIAVLTLLTMINGLPLGVLIVVVLASSFFAPTFAAARSATVPELFGSGPLYVRGVAFGRILQQVDQVLGFAIGGTIVALVTPRGALAIDAATFVASFLLLATHLRPRPAPASTMPVTPRSLVRDIRPNIALVLSHPARRALLLFSACALIFLIAPDSLAVPYAKQHGHGAVAAGILQASQPLGVAFGAWAFIRFVPASRQSRWLLPMAGAGASFLALTALVPPVWLTCVLWACSGMTQAFVVATIAAYNIVTERSLRGRANGMAASSIAITQGLGYLLWGGLADFRGAAAGVAWAGIVGLGIVAVARYLWPRDVIDAAWDRLATAQGRG